MNRSILKMLSLTLALLSATGARALDTFAAADPRSTIQTVISLTDRHALPSWDEATFGVRLHPYLTDDFLATVAKGGKIAIRKHINLYDAEFFTGAQGLAHVKLLEAEISQQSADAATVVAKVATTDQPNAVPTEGSRIQFELKRVNGVWRIDDFHDLEDYAKSSPSVKTRFGDPVRYGQ